jgi:hypothetical protein
MKTLKPPTMATWLLNKFGYGDHALAGDLLEDFGQRRSVAWYWRQVLTAIAVGIANTIRVHKVLALRAIVLGWTATFLTNYLIARPVFYLYVALLRRLGIIPNWLSWHYYDYPLLLPLCASAALQGWIVARFHRPHRAAMVFAYSASVLVWALPEFFRLATDATGNSRFLPYLWVHSIEVSLTAICILLGGLWSAEGPSLTPDRSVDK